MWIEFSSLFLGAWNSQEIILERKIHKYLTGDLCIKNWNLRKPGSSSPYKRGGVFSNDLELGKDSGNPHWWWSPGLNSEYWYAKSWETKSLALGWVWRKCWQMVVGKSKSLALDNLGINSTDFDFNIESESICLFR